MNNLSHEERTERQKFADDLISQVPSLYHFDDKERARILELECSICLQVLKPEQLPSNRIAPRDTNEPLLLACSSNKTDPKWYHRDCLVKCLLLKQECPFCRKEGLVEILATHN